MIKIDWASAVGGLIVGYYCKGKVEQCKAKVRSIINTNASEDLKNSFGDPQAAQQAQQAGQAPAAGQASGQSNG